MRPATRGEAAFQPFIRYYYDTLAYGLTDPDILRDMYTAKFPEVHRRSRTFRAGTTCGVPSQGPPRPFFLRSPPAQPWLWGPPATGPSAPQWVRSPTPVRLAPCVPAPLATSPLGLGIYAGGYPQGRLIPDPCALSGGLGDLGEHSAVAGSSS